MNEEIQRLALETIRKGIYKKNIHWIYGPRISIDEFQIVKRLGGSPGMSGWMIQKAHHKAGIQYQVSQDVSDDLMVTDFSETADIHNIPWPAPVVELYFEDPLLPTILVMKTSPAQLQKWFSEIEVAIGEPEYISGLMQEGSDVATAKQLSLQLSPSMYQGFLQEGDVVPMDRQTLFSTNLSKEDNASMCFMLHLALKVFTFSSISQYTPTPLSKKQMTKGGKPQVKGRPDKPSFRVAYTVDVREETKKETVRETATREFRGRRGVIRWFHHERFTHMRGKWIFIQPIKDPKTGKYPERSIFRKRLT